MFFWLHFQNLELIEIIFTPIPRITNKMNEYLLSHPLFEGKIKQESVIPMQGEIRWKNNLSFRRRRNPWKSSRIVKQILRCVLDDRVVQSLLRHTRRSESSLCSLLGAILVVNRSSILLWLSPHCSTTSFLFI